MKYIEILRSNLNNGKKYNVLTCKADFNNNHEDYRVYSDALDLLQQAIYNDNTNKSINACIVRVCQALEFVPTEEEVGTIRNIVKKSVIRSRQTMSEDDREIVKGFNETLKALEQSIHFCKPFTYNGIVYDNPTVKNELLETVKGKKSEFVKGANYECIELVPVSSNTFKKIVECAIGGITPAQYTSKLEKELTRLAKRLESGKITPDQYSEYVEKAKARFA